VRSSEVAEMRWLGWWWRRRRVEMAVDLTDPDAVLVELLASLPGNTLRAVLWDGLMANRHPNPPDDIAAARGQRMVDFVIEAARLRPELLVHFGDVTRFLVAWADKSDEARARM